MAELIGRFGAYTGKLTGQPAAYVAYFVFISVYVTLIYQEKPCPDDFKIIVYMLTGWFFANAVSWKFPNGSDDLERKVKDIEKDQNNVKAALKVLEEQL